MRYMMIVSCLGLSAMGHGASAETVQVPDDLCKYEAPSEAMISQVRERSDYVGIIKYLSNACPEVALIYADAATGSIPTNAAFDGTSSGGQRLGLRTNIRTETITETKVVYVPKPGPEPRIRSKKGNNGSGNGTEDLADGSDASPNGRDENVQPTKKKRRT